MGARPGRNEDGAARDGRSTPAVNAGGASASSVLDGGSGASIDGTNGMHDSPTTAITSGSQRAGTNHHLVAAPAAFESSRALWQSNSGPDDEPRRACPTWCPSAQRG